MGGDAGQEERDPLTSENGWLTVTCSYCDWAASDEPPRAIRAQLAHRATHGRATEGAPLSKHQRQQQELKHAVLEYVRERGGGPVPQVDLEAKWGRGDVRKLVESLQRRGDIETTGSGEQTMLSLAS